jgi:hypothetical protein
MHKARAFFYVASGVFLLALVWHLGATSASGQGSNALVSMADYPRLQNSAVAVDQTGEIYFGHLQQWSRVGTTPDTPVAIWSRVSDGGVFVALANGDLYQVGSPALPVGDWTLTYDSNVFGGPVPTEVSLGRTPPRSHRNP